MTTPALTASQMLSEIIYHHILPGNPPGKRLEAEENSEGTSPIIPCCDGPFDIYKQNYASLRWGQ